MAEQAEQVKNNFELKMEEAKADAQVAKRDISTSKMPSRSVSFSPVDGLHQDNVAPRDSLQTEQNPTNKIAPKSLIFPVDGLHQDDIITP